MKNIAVWVGVILAVGIVGYFIVKGNKSTVNVQPVACTMEALVCPDGSGVGRSGSKCAFSPCANHDSFEGVLEQGSTGPRLIMQPVSGVRTSYTMPLQFAAGVAFDQFVGTRVRVKGVFTEGNTLKVESIETLAGVVPDTTKGEIGVGQTAVINGLSVTLNDITQDSRCPVDVQCIAKGNVTVSVTLKSDKSTKKVTINSDAQPYAFGAYKVSITNITPVRASGSSIAKKDYKIQFMVVYNDAASK